MYASFAHVDLEGFVFLPSSIPSGSYISFRLPQGLLSSVGMDLWTTSHLGLSIPRSQLSVPRTLLSVECLTASLYLFPSAVEEAPLMMDKQGTDNTS